MAETMAEQGSRIFSAPTKDELFAAMRTQCLDLTYNDIRVATGPSEFDEHDVDLASRFSRNVGLKVPLVTAAMDTITEAPMAIAVAKMGGLGVIHAAMEPKLQRNAVRRVKSELNGKIEQPICFRGEQTLHEVQKEAEKKYHFWTFPVTDNDGLLIGLLTQNDFDLSRNRTGVVTVADAMTPVDQLTVAAPDLTIEGAYSEMQAIGKKTIPLVAEDMTVAGLYVWKDVDKVVNGDRAQYNLDDLGRLRTAAAVPTHESALERIEMMIGCLDVVVIDTSMGDHKFALRTLKEIKNTGWDIDVVVGNVSEPEGAFLLAENGADGVKVGQGPGSICTTRMEIGIGCPQATAVYNCVEAVRGMDMPICADGGVQNLGDLNVAIGLGASSIMAGGLFAGTDETPGEIVSRQGVLYKPYRGMGSEEAQKDSMSAKARYDASGKGSVLLAEGEEQWIAYKGAVTDVVMKAVIALRRGIADGRSGSVAQHRENARFRHPTPAGIIEGAPHDVEAVAL